MGKTSKRNKIDIPAKDCWYCVNYKGDPVKLRYSVPGEWMIEIKDRLPFDTYVYYYPKSNDIKSPSHSFLYQMIQHDFDNKTEGFVYSASVLRKFGRYQLYWNLYFVTTI